MPKPTARLIAAAPEMHALLHKLAYEPVGEAEATAAQILDALADEARALLARTLFLAAPLYLLGRAR